MYIDLVLCKHTNNGSTFLFQAPLASGLKENDLVVVDTKRGENVASIVSIETVEVGSNEFNFIIKATGAKLPLKKVLKKMVFREMEYKEDEDNE